MLLDKNDKALIDLLGENSRAPVSELARVLGLSRSTVKDRIERLERRGVITGYTLRFSDSYLSGQIQAHVMIVSNPKYAAQIVREFKKLVAVKALHAVNGIYDMIALISADSTKELDAALDQIGAVEGVEKTVSMIILSTKIEK